MIKSFKHRGLEKSFKAGSKAGIQPAHAPKLQLILTLLNNSKTVKDMNVSGWNLHCLSGTLAGIWSVRVNGNWRVTFRFEESDAEIVDYQDYH